MTQTIALYRDGRRVPEDDADADGPLEARLRGALGERRDGDLLWVLLEQPDDAALAAVADALELDEHAVTRLARARRPRLVRHEEREALVVRTLRYDDERDAVETGDLSVLYAPGLVVTVAHPAPPAQQDPAGRGVTEASTAPVDPEEVRRDLEGDPGALERRGADVVLHALLSAVVDSYLDVCAGLQADVEEVETSVFSPERTRDSQRIYVLKRELAEVRRAVLPLRDALRRLVTDADQPAGAPHVRDVVDRLLGVVEQVESLEGLLGTAFDAHLARIQVQQNDDMRKISAGVALVAGPTLVAAIYGMNFRDMPELHWALGYPFALGLMALVSLLTWIGFKRSGWL